MRWPHRLLIQMRMLFRRKEAGARLDDELQFHLDQQIAENMANGMSAIEARHAAMRSFGNTSVLREQSRDTWGWNRLEALVRDIRISIRTLARTPGFAAIVVLVMALGIGANVALFTLVRSVLMKPLPFSHQDQLVRIYEADAHGAFQDNIVAGGSYGVWRSQSHSFSQMGIKRWANYNLAGTRGQLPEVVLAQTASWSLFPMLGVNPALGRSFTQDDDRPEANATVMLTWGLWKRRYGGDPAIVGRSILLDAKPYTVVGVLPAWFTYPDSKVQLWTPLYHERSSAMMQMYVAHNFDVIGRLKPGVTIQQASAEINTLQSEIRKQFPDGPVHDAANLRPILDAEVHGIRTSLYTLLAATGCLLLIACLNIANLLVARSAARRKEMAIRAALGGSRMRLMRQQIMESLILAVAGGSLGLLFAGAVLQWLMAVRGDIPRADAIHMDGAVILFSIAAMLLCGLVAGLIPALSSGGRQVLRVLQESSRSSSGGQDKAHLRKMLLALEVGLTVVLLVGAGLLFKSYERLRSVDIGCATHDVLTMEINLPKGSYGSSAQKISFYEQLLERLKNLPGVRSVGIVTVLPGEGHRGDDVFTITEHPPLPRGQVLDALTRFVDPGYFRAMQIPVVKGRAVLPNERGEHALSVVVNQALVDKYFQAEDPIGRHIVASAVFGTTSLQIVGVVGNTLHDISSPPLPTIFYPLYAGSERAAVLVIRTKTGAGNVALPAQQAISGLDRDLPVANILTMQEVIGQSTLDARFNASLLIAFAVLSLILAAVGLFGVLSYLVAQRTTEIGIRIALGAQREQVLRLMLRDGLRPALLGLVLGLIASAGVTRLIQSMLYGTQPVDPAVFVLVTVTILLIAAGACAWPAWRASRIDPIQALRTE